MENPFALSWNDTIDKVYQSAPSHVPHVLEPSKLSESSALNTPFKPKYIGSGEDFCFELFEKD